MLHKVERLFVIFYIFSNDFLSKACSIHNNYDQDSFFYSHVIGIMVLFLFKGMHSSYKQMMPPLPKLISFF